MSTVHATACYDSVSLRPTRGTRDYPTAIATELQQPQLINYDGNCNYSNCNHSNGNHSNGNHSNGNHSNGNHSNCNYSNCNHSYCNCN